MATVSINIAGFNNEEVALQSELRSGTADSSTQMIWAPPSAKPTFAINVGVSSCVCSSASLTSDHCVATV